MQQIVETVDQVDGQEDENVQSERIVTSSEALVGIDSVLAYSQTSLYRSPLYR